MREIKFRAWNTCCVPPRMMYWGEDFYVICRDERTKEHPRMDIGVSPENKAFSLHVAMTEFAEKDMPHCLGDVILMEYTGLKDKNGKEIYEGDIVNIHPYDHISKRADVGEVFWMEAYHGWGIKCPDKLSFHSYHLHQIEEIEKIGNVHENPELLEKK